MTYKCNSGLELSNWSWGSRRAESVLTCKVGPVDITPVYLPVTNPPPTAAIPT